MPSEVDCTTTTPSPCGGAVSPLLPSFPISYVTEGFLMSRTSNPHGGKSSRSTESDWDETITILVTALAKGLGVLAWWSVLFPMISVPTVASLWVGFQCGPIFGVLVAAVSGL